MSTIVRGRVVTPDGIIPDGLVIVDGDRIAEVRPTGRVRKVQLRASWILPGFVDIHVHGGGGYTFTTGDAEAARGVAAFHLGYGTTTMLASLVTAAPQALREATLAYQPLIEDGTLAGLHFEGPYLSAGRCGAQNPAHLRDPDLTELGGLLSIGGVRMVTIAPELPLALDAIEMVVGAGALAAIGHTDATYEQTKAGITAGATVATHLYNAMRPVHHRDPGPIVALLEAPGVVCEQIADHVHLHDAMLRHTLATAGPDRIALVTDAMAAAGMPDGRYELGGQPVSVHNGIARLRPDGAIAGSTLTMSGALRRCIHSGIDMTDAARMAAATPARLLGFGDELGELSAGRRADLVLLDDELLVVGVLRAGEVVAPQADTVQLPGPG